MSLRRDFVLSLILGWRIVLFCVICSAGCSLASTQDLKRISIAIPLSSSEISKQLLKRPFKIRGERSVPFKQTDFFRIHHKPLRPGPSLTQTPKSQRLTSSNWGDTSCMVIQIAPLNIVKYGGMFWCGLRKKSVCYNSYKSDGSTGPWILNGLLSSFIDKCWYLS